MQHACRTQRLDSLAPRRRDARSWRARACVCVRTGQQNDARQRLSQPSAGSRRGRAIDRSSIEGPALACLYILAVCSKRAHHRLPTHRLFHPPPIISYTHACTHAAPLASNPTPSHKQPSSQAAANRMAATLVYQVPGDDWGIYLVGAWKRTLECREFGRGYEHQRTSNSVVVVEHAAGVAAEPGTYVRTVRVCVHACMCVCVCVCVCVCCSLFMGGVGCS